MLSGWGRPKQKTLKAGKSGRYAFTLHSEYKMREYHLSRQRVIRVIRSPRRTETGIVENTVAVMQPASTKRVGGKPARPGDPGRSGRETWSQEIWVMYKLSGKGKSQNGKLESLLSQPELKIISAWRYPGVSPERDPIPSDILREIARGLEESELSEEIAE
jgi:hypothetical protein